MTSLHLDPERGEACAAEPIHIPGAIQDHGFLLAIRERDLRIVACSVNVVDFLGRPADSVLGQMAAHVLAADGVRELIEIAWSDRNGDPRVFRVSADTSDGPREFEAAAHVSDGLLIVECEPAGAASGAELQRQVVAAAMAMMRAATIDELRAAITSQVRELTGYDRTMVYLFHSDGHGEVVAEARRAPEVVSYLGQHFPASDIPAQARRLYQLSRSRMIANVNYVPAGFVSLPELGEDPLDLSRSTLRAVSEYHLGFMRNMGTDASMSFSMVDNGEVTGLVSCTTEEPSWVPYSVRHACELLTHQFEVRLKSMQDAVIIERTQSMRTIVDGLHAAFQAGLAAGDTSTAVAGLTYLLPAAGVAARVRGISAGAGDSPPPEHVEALVAAVRSVSGGPADPSLATSCLTRDYPEFAALVPGVAGAVVLPLSDGGYLAWFNPEQEHTISWLGAPAPASDPSVPLSPRHSFEAWQELVRGQSAPWDIVGVRAALDLRRCL